MKKHICNFATLRFRPLQETGEFACFGVVMLCAGTKQFDFRICKDVQNRVAKFFGEPNRAAFKYACKGVESLLAAVKTRIDRLNAEGDLCDAATPDAIFDNLIRNRENIVNFSTPFTIACDDPQAEIDAQYGTIVMRRFATRAEYAEKAMRDRVKACLDEIRVSYQIGHALEYRSVKFHVPFFIGGPADRVIKPLNLEQVTPVDVFDIANKWKGRLELMNTDIGRENILMPLRMPGSDRADIRDTAHDAAEMLHSLARTFVVDGHQDEKNVIECFVAERG